MKTRLLVAGAVAAVLVGAACSKSSTGPSDAFSGTWSVTVKYLYETIVQDTGTVSPSPFALTIAKSGAAYTGTFPTLNFNFVAGGIPVLDVFDSSAAPMSHFAISGDTLSIFAPSVNANLSCGLWFTGTLSGGTAQGSVVANGLDCQNMARGVWTATKQ